MKDQSLANTVQIVLALQQEVTDLKRQLATIARNQKKIRLSDRLYFQKVQFMDSGRIYAGGTNGLNIATTSTQKLGFYGKSPVAQAAAISAPSGGATVDAPARTAIDSIITALHNIGITA